MVPCAAAAPGQAAPYGEAMRTSVHHIVALCTLLVLGGACSDDNPAKPNGGGTGVPDGFNGGDLEVADGSDVALTDSAGDDAPVAPDEEPCENDGGWGCVCTEGDDCNSGKCLESETGKVCTKTCVDSCPKNWQCKQAGTDDPTFICVPKFVLLCRPCHSHGDCGQIGTGQGLAKCIPNAVQGSDFINGNFCGSACAVDKDCPTDFSCKTIALPDEVTTTQCVPDSGDCVCSKAEVDLKLSTACWRANEFGKCEGLRTCTKDGLTLCNVNEPSAEVCDGEDNDCDGKVDEDGSVGCKTWFPDNDGDGAGITNGTCMCQNPGVGYSTDGGDCNDFANSIHPGAKEICNNVDDNCNGQTDESGASGCTNYFKDKDGDSFGDPDDAACLCPSKKTIDFIEQAGDVYDNDNKIKPGVPELCDGKDNNCNDKVDEENAAGCTLHYLDGDQDGYGPTKNSKCMCGPGALYTATKPGDCDDANPSVHPTKIETCNGVDDDCNGQTDDGDAPKSCPPVAKGQPACLVGKCAVGDCEPGYFNVDPASKGCECKADGNYGKTGGNCKGALDVGGLGDGGSKVNVSGNVMPGEDGDWYTFKATDNPEAEGGCDTFHVRARFLYPPPMSNPFVLDMYRGSCAGQSQICSEQTDVSWTVRYYGKPSGPGHKAGTPAGKKSPSPKPLPAGECKCSNKMGGSGPGAPGMNFCMDNTSKFYVRVRLKPGVKPTCENYKVELSNGVYKPTF